MRSNPNPQAMLAQRSSSWERAHVVGIVIFAIAIAAIGVETIVCAGTPTDALGYGYRSLPVIPWLPPVSWLAVTVGALFTICAVGLLAARTIRPAAIAIGVMFFLGMLLLCLPRGVVHLGSISLRTGVFEPIAIGGLAWILTARAGSANRLASIGRFAFAFSLIVFGVDHFLLLGPIGTLLPAWIPWHVFWIGFFGAAFIAAGLALATGYLQRWAAAGIALMYAIWVLTLHGPRVLGLYGIPGAPQSPAEWQSLFIAVAFCGGSLALAGSRALRVPAVPGAREDLRASATS